MLLVDAAQGIEAQTLANLYLAIDADLHIIPVLNKIDLPSAQPDKYAEELAAHHRLRPRRRPAGLGQDRRGRRGAARRDRRADPAAGRATPTRPPRALIFDSVYDTYRGVVTYVRVVDGKLQPPREDQDDVDRRRARDARGRRDLARADPGQSLGVGEVGYLITGVKDVRQSRVGDTVTASSHGATESLAGYKHPNPMVFAGLYPIDGDDYPDLRDALEKLQLNDAALVYEPETSGALGFGFRCGFLGLLHMEIVRERLEREFDLDLISTAPNVVYRVADGGRHRDRRAPTRASSPTAARSPRCTSPIVRATMLSPDRLHRHDHGAVPGQARRARSAWTTCSEDRVEIRYTLPLARDRLRLLRRAEVAHQGLRLPRLRAAGDQASDLVKVDILLQGEPVDAFSLDRPQGQGLRLRRLLTGKLKELIPRQQFEVPIQAAIGARVIARENIRAIRKDVLAKCYGGDITRKRKLLEKQKEGKKRMKMVGRVEVPQEAFVAALSTTQPTEKSGKK